MNFSKVFFELFMFILRANLLPLTLFYAYNFFVNIDVLMVEANSRLFAVTFGSDSLNCDFLK